MTELDKKFAAARSKMEQSPQRKRQTPPIGDANIDPADEQRRARTHRLVQIGALAEKYLNLKGKETEEVEQILYNIINNT